VPAGAGAGAAVAAGAGTAYTDIGDVTNARTLFERVLAEEANRKSQPLWERYLAFEFEFGDLPSALRLEKRARESLGELPGAGGASIRSTQLLLLRYEEQGMWPVAPQLRQHLQQLVGRGPGGGSGWNAGSAGLDGRRGSKDDVAAAAAGVNGALGSSGSGGLADVGVTVQDLLAGKYPPALQRFVEMLPNLAVLDGPMPNIDVMLDAIINLEGVGGGGVKREHEGDDDEEAAAALGMGGMHRDAYRARVKQRARMGSADG
jgi:cleavage stimulation factor subunit 3